MADFYTSLEALASHIETLFKSNSVTMYNRIEIDRGRRYTKLICRGESSGGCIWGFVDENGDVLKAASFNKPAKHRRGSIYDQESWKGFSWTGPQYLK